VTGWGPEHASAAKAWFEKAAALDHPDALHGLGVMEAKGSHGSEDGGAARRHLARAAQLGSEEAAQALHKLNCPFKLKSKDGKETGEFRFDGPISELRRTAPRCS